MSNDENETLPPGPTAEQWRVLRDCLPRPMQALDGPTALRVVGLLVERLEAGWSPDRIHDTLAGNALPPNVRSLGGLVLHRVGAIPVDGALVETVDNDASEVSSDDVDGAPDDAAERGE